MGAMVALERGVAALCALGAGWVLEGMTGEAPACAGMRMKARMAKAGAWLALAAPGVGFVLGWRDVLEASALWLGFGAARLIPHAGGSKMLRVRGKPGAAAMMILLFLVADELGAFHKGDWLLPFPAAVTCLILLAAAGALAGAAPDSELAPGDRAVAGIVGGLMAFCPLASVVARAWPGPASAVAILSAYSGALVFWVLYLTSWSLTSNAVTTLGRHLHKALAIVAVTSTARLLVTLLLPSLRPWDSTAWALVACGLLLVTAEALLRLWAVAR
jgi:hypothetical protein